MDITDSVTDHVTGCVTGSVTGHVSAVGERTRVAKIVDLYHDRLSKSAGQKEVSSLPFVLCGTELHLPGSEGWLGSA